MPAKKVSPDRLSLSDRLARLIQSSGPISVAHYMAEANAHYYATRDPLGAAGDFTTAPEISQMFGELIGLWLADVWQRAGAPVNAIYVELGPGRGTLAADARRAMRSAGLWPEVHLVETSPVLRDAQRQRVPDAIWHDDICSLPEDRPLLLVANEFFDALPVQQLVATEGGWRELLVDFNEGAFARVPGPAVPAAMPGTQLGTIVETSPASIEIMRYVARRLSLQGGAAIVFDYGHLKPGIGDTLQAVKDHAFASPFEEPGERDLTAHVDFAALRAAAEPEGTRVLASSQGEWLQKMGIDVRAAALAKGAPNQADRVRSAKERLVAADQMGALFKVMSVASRDWPEVCGFDD